VQRAKRRIRAAESVRWEEHGGVRAQAPQRGRHLPLLQYQCRFDGRRPKLAAAEPQAGALLVLGVVGRGCRVVVKGRRVAGGDRAGARADGGQAQCRERAPVERCEYGERGGGGREGGEGRARAVGLASMVNMQIHMKQYNIVKCMTLDTVHCKTNLQRSMHI
jgi:hypothetical protein